MFKLRTFSPRHFTACDAPIRVSHALAQSLAPELQNPSLSGPRDKSRPVRLKLPR